MTTTQSHNQRKVSVLGAGSWGTALAIQFARNGLPTQLWGRNPERIEEMSRTRCNPQYLSDITFPEQLQVSSDLESVVRNADILLIAVPSSVFRQTLESIRDYIPGNCLVTWATKGLEQQSGKLLHQVFAEVLGDSRECAVVSGPTFAKEVALGLPTAVTVASKSEVLAEQIAGALHGESFRAYTSQDLISVELGGACKNVLAIAAGISDGLGFGANARAALITRGLAEMVRLGVALGGQPETLMGLAGLGDLVLTCTDNQSRNRRVGLGLGEGRSLAEITEEIGQAVEGVKSAPEIHRVAMRLGVDMPIAEQVYRVLYEGLPAADAVGQLLERAPKSE
ncbi:MAG: NAD(P)-dependent glycerol-3-phosphate dehydrogenase [Gammaproteobacteria bacterium]|nr:NAD(P)-dependent glycerol-3-phosphate dehydrogenase [Gammaproteobacteria bacterium]